MDETKIPIVFPDTFHLGIIVSVYLIVIVTGLWIAYSFVSLTLLDVVWGGDSEWVSSAIQAKYKQCPLLLPNNVESCSMTTDGKATIYTCKDGKKRQYQSGDPCSIKNPILRDCSGPLPKGAVSCSPVSPNDPILAMSNFKEEAAKYMVQYKCQDETFQYNGCEKDDKITFSKDCDLQWDIDVGKMRCWGDTVHDMFFPEE